MDANLVVFYVVIQVSIPTLLLQEEEKSYL